MHQVYLGLGTNLGQRLLNLKKAIAGLQAVMSVTAVSPIYETEPWGVTDQPPFYNLCLSASTSLAPLDLLKFNKNLENTLGREKSILWGPRLIDIDILLFDDLILEEELITIPHPHMQERSFVLLPLADIAPDVVHPRLHQTVAQLCGVVDATTAKRLDMIENMDRGESDV